MHPDEIFVIKMIAIAGTVFFVARLAVLLGYFIAENLPD
jgi:hypothetical protein